MTCFAFLLALLSSCGNSQQRVQKYEQMVDSIRKSEQVRQMERQSGIGESPLTVYFDTLQYHSLPIRSGDDPSIIVSQCEKALPSFSLLLGFDASDEVRVLRLPRSGRFNVCLASHKGADESPVVYLFTLNRSLRVVDMLCIYERKAVERVDDSGQTESEFFITSNYEITVVERFKSDGDKRNELFQTHRHTISDEGRFVQVEQPAS